nr:hypothetical protein GCM10020092_089260 [Actinoplanes digitatis]
MTQRDLQGVVAVERRVPRDAVVCDRAEGVNIGCRGDVALGDLLGRHVERRADDRVEAGHAGHGGGAGHAEVDKDHGAVGLDDQVAGLDVAVHRAVLVGGVQGVARLRHDRHGLGDAEAALLLEPGGERLAVHIRHHEVSAVVLVVGVPGAVVVDLDDAGVAEGGHHPRLAVEAGGELRVGEHRGAQHLDGDRAAEHHVGATPHVTHATGGDALVQPVAVVQETSRTEHQLDLSTRVSGGTEHDLLRPTCWPGTTVQIHDASRGGRWVAERTR